jgi:hypothetical protein
VLVYEGKNSWDEKVGNGDEEVSEKLVASIVTLVDDIKLCSSTVIDDERLRFS